MLFFEHAGARIAYDFYQSKVTTTQLLVLINGYQRTRLDFRALCRRLSEKCPSLALLAFDNRFCGQTEVFFPSQNTSIEQMAEDAVALVRQHLNDLKLQRFSVLGISMGGMIAQCVAARNPHAVETLFLVSTTAGGEGRTWPTGHERGEYKARNFETLEACQKHMARYFGAKFLKNSPLLFDMLCKTMMRANTDLAFHDQSQKQFYASRDFDGVAALKYIQASKIVVFSGDEDHVIPIENAEFLKKHIPNSELVVYKGVGHLILIEEPEVFSNHMASYL